MSIDRPRRIFRPAHRSLAQRRLGMFVVAAAAIVALGLAAVGVADAVDQPTAAGMHARC